MGLLRRGGLGGWDFAEVLLVAAEVFSEGVPEGFGDKRIEEDSHEGGGFLGIGVLGGLAFEVEVELHGDVADAGKVGIDYRKLFRIFH